MFHPNEALMDKQIKAVILENDIILIDGRTLVEQNEIAEALTAILQNTPNFILVIEPKDQAYYKGIAKVIYASQRAGVPIENLRFTTEHGEVVTFDELRAANPTQPV
jgi:biopolymer transport protein ExbD